MVLPFALQIIAFSQSTGCNVKQKNKILEIIPFLPGKLSLFSRENSWSDILIWTDSSNYKSLLEKGIKEIPNSVCARFLLSIALVYNSVMSAYVTVQQQDSVVNGICATETERRYEGRTFGIALPVITA